MTVQNLELQAYLENQLSQQGCTNPECHVPVETKFSTVTPSICESQYGTAYVILLAPRILRWLLDY